MAASSSPNTVRTFKKPMVSLYLNFGEACGLEVFINDIPVTPAAFFNGGPTGTYIPVNQYLKPRGNILSVVAWRTKAISPENSQISDCSADLIIWDFSTMRASSSEAVTLGKYTLSLYKGMEYENIKPSNMTQEIRNKILQGELDFSEKRGARIGPVKLEYEKDFGWWTKRAFDPGFKIPPSKWQSSEKIVDNAATRKSVTAMYQSLWNIHQSNGFDLWNRINLEKDSETARMTHTTVEELLKQSTQLPPLIRGDDKNWELIPIDFSTAKTRIVANGQLVTMLNKNWKPIISYKSIINDNFAITVPIYLRSEGNQWVIAR